jgi:hypothetical protein
MGAFHTGRKLMHRHTLLRAALAAGIVAFVAGCSGMGPSEKVDVFEATLSGSQEVPATPSAGTGQAEVHLNTRTNMITWKVTYSGLTGPAVAAHIHGPAAMGANAGVLVPFSNVGAQPITGQATLTAPQVAELQAGRMYVNVHTKAHPGGEIRGQLHHRG